MSLRLPDRVSYIGNQFSRIYGVAWRNDKDNEAGSDTAGNLSAHGDGSTWTVFDCREINDLTRIYPFGSLNRRWSGVWLITSALHTERDCLNSHNNAWHSCLSNFEKFLCLTTLKFSYKSIFLNFAEEYNSINQRNKFQNWRFLKNNFA